MAPLAQSSWTVEGCGVARSTHWSRRSPEPSTAMAFKHLTPLEDLRRLLVGSGEHEPVASRHRDHRGEKVLASGPLDQRSPASAPSTGHRHPAQPAQLGGQLLAHLPTRAATPCLASPVSPIPLRPTSSSTTGVASASCSAVKRPGGGRVDRHAQPHGGHHPVGLAAESQNPVAGERSDHGPDTSAPVAPERDLPEGEPEAHQHRGERQGQRRTGQDHQEPDGQRRRSPERAGWRYG